MTEKRTSLSSFLEKSCELGCTVYVIYIFVAISVNSQFSAGIFKYFYKSRDVVVNGSPEDTPKVGYTIAERDCYYVLIACVNIL